MIPAISESLTIKWPECIVELPHIVADPCKPRWVVRCEHDQWFWSQTQYWNDKRDEKEAYFALIILLKEVIRHSREVNNEQH